ncbi:MAG: cell division protein ZapA, partial [Lachnospiraceae bacterium]|nr:cell division protein ZapA [Lachnospiraceae bacterium]
FAEIKKQDIYKNLDSEMRAIFLEINLVDEYFKMKNKYEESEADSESKSNEIYSMKHEIMSLQSKLEIAQNEIEKQKALNIEEQKKNIKLETELSSERKNRKSSDD